ITWVSLNQHAIGAGRFDVIVLLLEQLRLPINCARGQGVLGMPSPDVIIGLDRAADISFFLRLLSGVEKLLCVSADFLFPGSDVFYFFSRPENDRSLSATGETERSNYNNKQSHSHETSQGICLRDPVKLART